MTNEPLSGAHFALYRSVDGIGGAIKDLYPIPGYEDLVSDANGVMNLSIILDTFNSNKFKLRHSIFDSIACASQPVANHHLKNKFCGYSSSS